MSPARIRAWADWTRARKSERVRSERRDERPGGGSLHVISGGSKRTPLPCPLPFGRGEGENCVLRSRLGAPETGRVRLVCQNSNCSVARRLLREPSASRPVDTIHVLPRR